MATERDGKHSQFDNDFEQETNDHLDATILDIRTRELAQAKKAYDQANERYFQSPSVANGSRREEARTKLELARRAYKLHLDHMAEETVKAVWLDEKGEAIQ